MTLDNSRGYTVRCPTCGWESGSRTPQGAAGALKLHQIRAHQAGGGRAAGGGSKHRHTWRLLRSGPAASAEEKAIHAGFAVVCDGCREVEDA